MTNLTESSGQKMTSTAQALKRLLILILILLFTLLTYTFLHEGGHALVGLLCGGKLTSFDVNFFNLTAHVGLDGEFSAWQDALISLSGISFPILFWAVWMLLTPKIANPLLEWFRLIASMGVINSLLAWIVIPFLFLAGNAPGDDSTNFLSLTRFPPMVVSIAALLVYLAGWILFLEKVEGKSGLLARLKRDPTDLRSPGSIQTLRNLAAVAIVILAIIIGLNQVLGQSSAIVAPNGYSQVAAVDLSNQPYQSAMIYHFNLSQPTPVNLFILMENVQTGPFTIEMTGPEGYRFTFIHFDQKQVGIGKASSHPKDLLLAKGDYQILLTVTENHGKISLYESGIPEP